MGLSSLAHRPRLTAAPVPAALLIALALTLPAGAAAGQSSGYPATPPQSQVVTGEFHSCAVGPNAGLRCWGFGRDGQLGYGNVRRIGDDETVGSMPPVDLGAGRTVSALAAGYAHTCALLDDATVRCFGFGFDGELGYGLRNQVGDDETPASVGPVNLGAGRTATAVTAGMLHTCAVLDTGDVRCWGRNETGELGIRNANARNENEAIGDNETPASVGPVNLGGQLATAVAAGDEHTCALIQDGTVRCWGGGLNGQLGYGDTSPILDAVMSGPVDLGAGRTARAITAGDAHTCALLDDGSVRCWGANDFGQLGYGNTRTIGDNTNETPGKFGPVNLGPGRTARAISAGRSFTCAVLDNGSVRCWGLGGDGQLGYGTTATIGDNELPSSVGPVDLGAGRTATAISAGAMHTCARLDDGSVRCWGAGRAGRLGYCNELTIGDDELPSVAGPVDLGTPGIAAATCSPKPPQPAAQPVAPTVTGPSPTPAAPDPLAEALAAQQLRRTAFRACTRRAGALPRAKRPAAIRDCVRRHGRVPGRVSNLVARSLKNGRVRLSFRVAGTDGPRGPAASGYLIKQSLRPIRTARDFATAPSLCKGTCRFKVSATGGTARLTVAGLRRGRVYYYALAARDNVSDRTGPRSAAVRVSAG